jgi:hypothetical protein
LSSFLPFGFRTDLNHMEVLKALPIRPVSIAAAEVISASIIGCLGQWLLIVVWLATAPSLFLVLLAGAAFCIPFNLLLFGSGYVLLLLFPYQLVASGPDVTLMGRTMIMFMGHLFALALGAGIAAVPAVGCYLLTGSEFGALLTGWCTLLALGVGLINAVAWAFGRFDVSSDMPD